MIRQVSTIERGNHILTVVPLGIFSTRTQGLGKSKDFWSHPYNSVKKSFTPCPTTFRGPQNVAFTLKDHFLANRKDLVV